METQDLKKKGKVRIFADKRTKRWFGAYAWAILTEIPNTKPPTFKVEETVDDDAEFKKNDKVFCVTDYKNELVATWKA